MRLETPKGPIETPLGALKTARLIQRLPTRLREAQVISMSMQDHYVEVTTSNGTSLLLMRLSDAIRETDGIAGLQVHRSHWVALDQVSAAIRQGDRATLTMVTGDEVPVSRTYLNAIKEAGLLPTKSGQ